MKLSGIILASIVTFGFWSDVIAEESSALMLYLKTGRQVAHILDQHPVLTFANNELVVTTPMNTVSYPDSLLSHYVFTKYDPEAVSVLDSGQAAFSFKGNRLTAYNLEPNSSVMVYSADGLLLTEVQSDDHGNVAITLNQLVNVCVVKTSIATFKVSRQ